jgi:hypothetical protein
MMTSQWLYSSKCMTQLFNGWRARLREIVERGKCNSCGDYTELYEYNKSKSCAVCLGMDRRGVSRPGILKRNVGKRNEQIRRVRKKRW